MIEVSSLFPEFFPDQTVKMGISAYHFVFFHHDHAGRAVTFACLQQFQRHIFAIVILFHIEKECVSVIHPAEFGKGIDIICHDRQTESHGFRHGKPVSFAKAGGEKDIKRIHQRRGIGLESGEFHLEIIIMQCGSFFFQFFPVRTIAEDQDQPFFAVGDQPGILC